MAIKRRHILQKALDEIIAYAQTGGNENQSSCDLISEFRTAFANVERQYEEEKEAALKNVEDAAFKFGIARALSRGSDRQFAERMYRIALDAIFDFTSRDKLDESVER